MALDRLELRVRTTELYFSYNAKKKRFFCDEFYDEKKPNVPKLRTILVRVSFFYRFSLRTMIAIPVRSTDDEVTPNSSPSESSSDASRKTCTTSEQFAYECWKLSEWYWARMRKCKNNQS